MNISLLSIFIFGFIWTTSCDRSDEVNNRSDATSASAEAVKNTESKSNFTFSSAYEYQCKDGSRGAVVCGENESGDHTCSVGCIPIEHFGLMAADPLTTSPSPTPQASSSPEPIPSPSPSIKPDPEPTPTTSATPTPTATLVPTPTNMAKNDEPWKECPIYKMKYSEWFDCDDYAWSMDWWCSKNGIECYQIGFTACKAGMGHAFNVIEKGPRKTVKVLWTYTTYCAVEPQSNRSISCWEAELGKWEPPSKNKDIIIADYATKHPGHVCAKAWDFWDNCYDPLSHEKPFTHWKEESKEFLEKVGCGLPKKKW